MSRLLWKSYFVGLALPLYRGKQNKFNEKQLELMMNTHPPPFPSHSLQHLYEAKAMGYQRKEPSSWQERMVPKEGLVCEEVLCLKSKKGSDQVKHT